VDGGALGRGDVGWRRIPAEPDHAELGAGVVVIDD